MKIKTFSLVTVAALTLMGAAISSVQANEGSPVGPNDKQLAPAAPLVISAKRVLKSTTIVSDNAFTAVAGGFQPIHGPITMTCPGTGTCTLEAAQNVQVQGAGGGAWAICTQVDGFFVSEPSCPFLGSVPTDGSFGAGSFAQSASNLGPGNHTVQSFIFTSGAANLSIYNIVYRIYKP